jgi:hypothetical protein
LYLLRNNALAHSLILVSKFLVKQNIPPLSHAHYFPDFALADLLLFSKLKIVMRETGFVTVSSIQQTVMRELKAIWKEAFIGHLIHSMMGVNVVPKQVGTILSDGINTCLFV